MADSPPPKFLLWIARLAIAALALYRLWSFIDYLPGLSVKDGITNFYTFQLFVMIYMVQPLCALTALVLAVQGRRLWLAAVLAAIPVAYDILGVLIFAVGVMIYGF